MKDDAVTLKMLKGSTKRLDRVVSIEEMQDAIVSGVCERYEAAVRDAPPP